VRATLGKSPTGGPLLGVARHVVVADTDEAALCDRATRLSALARQLPLVVCTPRRRAADRGALSAHLRRAGCRSTTASPDRLAPYADFVAAEVKASASNYLLSWFAFGDMTVAESLRSVELFSREVMPAFAHVRADAAE
jgi:hypothetical protein